KNAIRGLKTSGVTRLICTDPIDFILEKRLRDYSDETGQDLQLLQSPLFLNSPQQNQDWRASQKRWFMAEYYKAQRRRLNLLMDGDQPTGGKWSYDEENRKKVPKAKLSEIPQLPRRDPDELERAAQASIKAQFPDNYGALDDIIWPTSHRAAAEWLELFLQERFDQFGAFEDAIAEGEELLWHSALTPMLNVGLLTPHQIIEAAVHHIERRNVPINSAEGFIRQIIGWREFMRATYEDLGVRMRTSNHWGHERDIPEIFWTGKTGIPPIDDTIQRTLKTGYSHHIERLMVIGGFMFLCEFSPKQIYRWFMELFVDAYDWVMVPNVYAMSQHADGGLITTKPYFSGSAYVRKMSHYPKGEWCEVWDGLYWRWIWKNAEQLQGNPRWAMMVSMVRKMDTEKRERHLANAETFLAAL
ncbi:MAG: cryptochrome/photolyase family protein, partial [Pseudomonadota bacterium]